MEKGFIPDLFNGGPRPPEKLFKIGEVMYYSGLSRQIIHNYTQLGLIKEKKRTPSGHRLYGEDVFKRISRIKELKAQGLHLMHIREIIEKEFDFFQRDSG